MRSLTKVVIVLGLCLAGGGAYYYTSKQKKNERKELIEIEAKRRTLTVSVQATAEVSPQNRVQILPPVAGRIDQIYANEGDMVKEGQVLAQMSSTFRASLIDLANANAKKQDKEMAQAYMPTSVFAPVSGRIIKKDVVQGQTVTQSSSLFEMSDHLIIVAKVDETDLAAVKVGQKADITIDAFPKNNYEGSVTSIANQSAVINNVNVYDVDLALKTEADELRSGMTANVNFISAVYEDVMSVPVWAVVADKNDKATLYDELGQAIEVQLGVTDGKFIEVKDLAEGQKVFAAKMDADDKGSKGSSPFSPFKAKGKKK